MPGAVKKPISYRAESGRFSSTPLGWILHVVVGNGSPYKIFENAAPGNRRFSNFWVSKTGVIEQYTETYCKSWAQRDGNSTYWAVETEGFPDEPLTPEQIASLGKIHAFLGAVDAIASHPGQRGIGTHYMGGAAWGGHTCPDPVPGAGPRSHQRQAILDAANGVDVPLSSTDLDNIVNAVFGNRLTNAIDGTSTARFDSFVTQSHKYATLAAQNAASVLRILDGEDAAGLSALCAAIVDALPAPAAGGLTADQVKQAVKDALKEGVAP